MTKHDRGPLMEIRNLATWFPIRRGVLARTVGHVKAVNGVSLTIGRGETVALVGESGCGKSTLGRTLLGFERAHAGQILYGGQDLAAPGPRRSRALRRELQMIFQDPQSSLNPRMTVLDIVTEGMLEHGLIHPEEKESAARQLLQDVGLDASAFHRYPFEFSGGQRQRISIARALSMRPSLIVCDEAVSALDVSVQAQVLNLLLDLKDKYALSYLFISHDLGVVRFIADRVAVMYLGHIVEEGPTLDVMERPQHPYTQALLSAVPVPGQPRKARVILSGELPSPARPPPGCPFHTRCPAVMPVCRQVFPATQLVSDRNVACHLHDRSSRESAAL